VIVLFCFIYVVFFIIHVFIIFNTVLRSFMPLGYRLKALHYLKITYCREQVYKVKVNDVDGLRQRIQSPDCMG